MLHAEDNKFLIEPDGEPKKIIVLDEEPLAFRDSRGVVGVIDHASARLVAAE